MDDRLNVFGSIAVSCFVNFLSIPLFIYLCPNNRDEIFKLKKGLGKSKFQALCYVATFSAMYLLSLLYNVLVMIPSVQCSPVLGGHGCNSWNEKGEGVLVFEKVERHMLHVVLSSRKDHL